MASGDNSSRGPGAIPRAIVETARNPLAVVDEGLRLVFANPAFYAAFGLAPEQALGEPLLAFATQPWNRPPLPALIGDVLRERRAFTRIAATDRDAGGRARTWLFDGRQLGNEPLVLLSAEDVTARRAATAHLASIAQSRTEILESITDAFYAVDNDWRLTYVNRRAAGFWPGGRDELVGRRLWDLVPNITIENTPGFELHQKAKREGRPIEAEFESVVLGRTLSMSLYPHPGGMAVYFRDVTDRKRAEVQQTQNHRELAHRVKNLLAVVASLARQTRADSVEQYRTIFLDRLHALARVHMLVSNAQWRESNLRALVEMTLAPYATARPDRIVIEGEPVELKASQCLSLALVLHELATNAVKYGALARPEGRITIGWENGRGDAGRQLEIRWRERNGPRVRPPLRKSFGVRLVEGTAANDLGGRARLCFAPGGLTCTITFPLPG
jgi:PAS domain S-box-containing protein